MGVRATLLAMLASVALASAACGGEPGAGPRDRSPGAGDAPAVAPAPKGPRLSRAQFVRRANGICARGEAEARRLVERRLPSTDPDDLRRDPPSAEVRVEALTERAITALRYQQRLRALRPPARLEPSWRRFLDRSEKAVLRLPDVARAVAQEDPAELNEVFADYLELAAANQVFADRYGLERCAPEARQVPELEGLRTDPR